MQLVLLHMEKKKENHLTSLLDVRHLRAKQKRSIRQARNFHQVPERMELKRNVNFQ